MQFIFVLRVLLLALLVTLIMGCSRTRPVDKRPANELVFWNGFTGPDGKTMEKMVADFQRANPDLLVKMQVIPWSHYYDKLTLGLAFDSGPDLFILQAHRVPEFAKHKALRALEDLLNGPDGLPWRDFSPVPWAAAQAGGRVYAIPLDCYPLGLYYNRAHFKAAGIVDHRGEPAPPKTWSEFLAAAKKLTVDRNGDGRPDQWGFSITNRYSNWATFVGQQGGSLLDAELRRAALTSPEVLAGTRQLRSLITEHRAAPSPDTLDSWMGFRQGRVSMVLEGIYMLNDLKKSTGLDYGAAPVPKFGPVEATWGGSHMLCMPARLPDARARAAWRLARYLSDHSLEWADGGQTPVRRSLQGSPAFKKMWAQSAFAQQLPYVKYDPPSPRATEIGPFVESAVEAALLGLETPEAAMADGEARINRVLARP